MSPKHDAIRVVSHRYAMPDEGRKDKTIMRTGMRVTTTMGVKLTGVIIPWIPLNWCTDGTYRGPLTPRESKEWVSVLWDDGTAGYSSKVHLAKVQA